YRGHCDRGPSRRPGGHRSGVVARSGAFRPGKAERWTGEERAFRGACGGWEDDLRLHSEAGGGDDGERVAADEARRDRGRLGGGVSAMATARQIELNRETVDNWEFFASHRKVLTERLLGVLGSQSGLSVLG